MKKMILIGVLIMAALLVSCRTYKVYINESKNVDVIIIQEKKNGVFVTDPAAIVKNDKKTKKKLKKKFETLLINPDNDDSREQPKKN
jgi:hypothetical protein